MKKRIINIAPWQAAKTSAVVYFLLGLIIVVPFGFLVQFLPVAPGQHKPGIGLFIALPFIYALAGLIFVPLGCWIYNKAVRLVGGLEITVEEDTAA